MLSVKMKLTCFHQRRKHFRYLFKALWFFFKLSVCKIPFLPMKRRRSSNHFLHIAQKTDILISFNYSSGARNWVGKKKSEQKKRYDDDDDLHQFCTWSNYSLSCRSFCLSLPLSTSKKFFLCFPLPQSI